MTTTFDVFLAQDALNINRARLNHLATLGLELQNKRVLEVGAGIGLLTGFFEERGCDVLSTEGNSANVAEMRRRYPQRRIGLLDLDYPGDLTGLGSFDVIFCYGTLYHLQYPDLALAQLANVCSGMILLETIVRTGNYPEVQLMTEPPVANQALFGVGCRPTRSWVMAALRKHFGHAYTTLDQPDFPDFVGDWDVVNKEGNLRAVFVGSKRPLAASGLTETLLVRHRHASRRTIRRRPSRVWIDVGARGEHSIAAAVSDPSLMVHAFEPLPALHEKLVHAAPANLMAHAMAVYDGDGVASIRINGSGSTSSLTPIGETAPGAFREGHLVGKEPEFVVQTTRLETFMRHNGIGTVELLKINAPGADLAVLRSLGDRIKDIKQIRIETGPKAGQVDYGPADEAALIAFLAERGFVIEPPEGQAQGKQGRPIVARQSSLDPTGAPPEDPENDATGLYELKAFETAAGNVRFLDDRLEVTTTAAQWAYAAVIPVDRTRAPKGSIVRLDLALDIDAGSLEAGILNEAETSFITAVSCEAGPLQTVELVIPCFDAVGRLVLRNAYANGPSHGWCRLLRITTEMPDEPKAGAWADGEYASQVAAQIRTSAMDLAGKLAESPMPPPVIAEIKEAAELMLREIRSAAR
ncbi:methyltransferase, FkbM family [Rhizobiales bacterium GAS191]|nr:methyltransferase, FkbM family [Rhizobiales bacterium GAS191]